MSELFNKNSNDLSTIILESLIEILPYSVVVCNVTGEILFYNNKFITTVPYEFVSKHNEQGLCGDMVCDVVNQSLSCQLQNINELTNNQMLDNCVIQEIEYNSSIFFINDNKQFVLIMRDCSNIELIKEELKERLEVVIGENHDMVRQIGQLMGESTVKRVKVLNSFIKALR